MQHILNLSVRSTVRDSVLKQMPEVEHGKGETVRSLVPRMRQGIWRDVYEPTQTYLAYNVYHHYVQVRTTELNKMEKKE